MYTLLLYKLQKQGDDSMEKSKETSFERMNMAVREMVKEDLGVDVACCKSHTSKTLKVVADPENVNTVDVYVPYQIFVGAKTIEACADWNVEFWKMAFRQLSFEFGVKSCPRTRLMSRKVSGANPRTYADFFWKNIESMAKWNIKLPEIPATAKKTGSTAPITITATSASNGKKAEVSEKYDVQKAYEMLGMKFACL